jgi:DNA-binding IclR family transcriptional regulator
VDPDARAAFDRIADAGQGTSAEVAADLGWPPERAAAALQTLSLLRLVQAAGATYCLLPLPA